MRTNDGTELHEVHQTSLETAISVEPDVENFLEPLVFVWDEDWFVVSEAIRKELAIFNADH